MEAIELFIQVTYSVDNRPLLINIANIAWVDPKGTGTIICFNSDTIETVKQISVKEDFERMKSLLNNCLPVIQLTTIDDNRPLMINTSNIDWIDSHSEIGTVICFNFSINGISKCITVKEDYEKVKSLLSVITDFTLPQVLLPDDKGFVNDIRTGKKITLKEYLKKHPSEKTVIITGPKGK